MLTTEPAPFVRRDSGYFQRDSTMYTHTPASTLFEKHLEDVYASTAPIDGSAFFETSGYYDSMESNTVHVFMNYIGIKSFWGEGCKPAPERVARSEAEQFEEVEENACLTELFNEYMQSQAAVSKIQHETSKFKASVNQALQGVKNTVQAIERLRLTMLCESANDGYETEDSELGSEASFADSVCLAGMHNSPSTLQPYFGHLRILKNSGFHFLSSWHKRWFYLDFAKGELLFFKRSYWKIPKGKLEMKSVTKIAPLNKTDFQLELLGGFSCLVRASSMEKMELWVNLLLYARRQARANDLATQRPISSSAFSHQAPSLNPNQRTVAWLENQPYSASHPTPRSAEPRPVEAARRRGLQQQQRTTSWADNKKFKPALSMPSAA
ncbi:hypothetical protein SDRG_16828 [Saprolegnia diclina VS20]|uniref:PH domain-containing protein n=1 Tax=Saprolegnia diclina (strain VS20) TaxID=1156394 RepID=T0PSS0_SAPDV|nr:hypothetical protein SDRG_16828 [Saprolegnia diclina VS20]EQC25306.1 hypothetical protein SDRG_16828 [Saprolegnia diclina VS20]|eukprot:XP_008621272.1 hypothetical protein SDRG_16828 [Saprolegnia diclina VS20]